MEYINSKKEFNMKHITFHKDNVIYNVYCKKLSTFNKWYIQVNYTVNKFNNYIK